MGVPEEALKLSKDSLQLKQLQTRRFNKAKMVDLVSAAAGVVQDLGYNIDESEAELGLIVGSKKRSARDKTQMAGSIFITVLSAFATQGRDTVNIPVDKEQYIRISLVVRPMALRDWNERSMANEKRPLMVRVNFQRVVWNTANEVTRQELITDPKIYQTFFQKLSKSIFLEAHKI